MEIFKDSSDLSTNNYDIKYNQIIFNQVNYNPKRDLLSIKSKNDINDENQIKDYKIEILNGDFIQSIVLLSEHKINITDTYNEDGDTILHLACKYMNFNVIRTLVEKFNANINLQNLNNQTPFYLVCDTKYFEQEIISYFFKQKDLNYEIEDKNGINPLLLSIKNHNMNLFYALCSIGCDLNHKDIEYHDIYYYAIKYDNLPALQYLLKYSQVDLFSSNNNLTPILIKSQGNKCCKYLFKYHYHKVINGITEPLNKGNYKKEEFNLFNFSDITSLITSIICVILCYYLLMQKTQRKIKGFYNKFFNFSYDKKKDSLLGICEDSLKNNILNLPGTGEACALCLTKKTRNIQHCNKCDLCVRNYFFHSNLLGICINSDNALIYSLLNFIFAMKLFTFISLLYSLTIESEKLYVSFSFYKFIGVIIGGNMLMKLFAIFLFINGFICLGISLTTFLCIGYNASYYLIFKQHIIPYGRILQRKIYGNIVDYLAPIINLVSVPTFFKNLIYKSQIEYV